MDRNTKKSQDDTLNAVFFIGSVAFYTIWKINENGEDMLSVEVFRGDFLVDSTDAIAVDTERLHDGTIWTSYKVADKFNDALELWRGGSISVAWETIDMIDHFQTGIFYDVKGFSNMGAEFSTLVLLKMVGLCWRGR